MRSAAVFRSLGLTSAAFALCACASHAGNYSGTVQTESVTVGSQTGGRVSHVDVATGSRVRKGDVLVRLDPSMLQAQMQQSDAQARAAAERLAELEHGNVPSEVARARAQSAQAAAQYGQTIAQAPPQASARAAAVRDAEAAERDARAAVRLASITLHRTQSLAASGDVSRQALDQARTEYSQAKARYAQAQARVAQSQSDYAALVEAQIPAQQRAAHANAAAQAAAYETVRNGTRAEQIAQAQAQLVAARAAADYARTRLAEALIRAPADGTVESIDLHPGDLLGPNQQAAIIDTFADPYVYIYASQSDLARLARGTKLRVVSDAGGAVFEGTVEAQDRTAQFTPQNTETADQRAELVYGLKVRINDPDRRLLDGTTVTIRVP